MTKVKLTYFKSSGKYYDHAYYDSTIDEYAWEIYVEVRNWATRHATPLPGRLDNTWDGYILVEPEDGVPALIDSTYKFV